MNIAQLLQKKCTQFKRKIIMYLHKKYSLKQMEEYISKKYKAVMRYDMNWDKPISYTQKIQYSKLYNTDKRRTWYSDKVVVRDYMKKTIGEKYLIPILGIWSNANDINFDNLPDKFMLKTNHGSAINIK